jgi:hypothetical protein
MGQVPMRRPRSAKARASRSLGAGGLIIASKKAARSRSDRLRVSCLVMVRLAAWSLGALVCSPVLYLLVMVASPARNWLSNGQTHGQASPIAPVRDGVDERLIVLSVGACCNGQGLAVRLGEGGRGGHLRHKDPGRAKVCRACGPGV